MRQLCYFSCHSCTGRAEVCVTEEVLNVYVPIACQGFGAACGFRHPLEVLKHFLIREGGISVLHRGGISISTTSSDAEQKKRWL